MLAYLTLLVCRHQQCLLFMVILNVSFPLDCRTVVLPQVICQMPLKKPQISTEIYIAVYVSHLHMLSIANFTGLKICPMTEMTSTQLPNRDKGSMEGTC